MTAPEVITAIITRTTPRFSATLVEAPGGGGGTFEGDHNDLDGRDAADAHPASAIDVDGTPLDEVLVDLPFDGIITKAIPNLEAGDLTDEEPTKFFEMWDHGAEHASAWGTHIDVGGGTIIHSFGFRFAEFDTDSTPTGRWFYWLNGPQGPQIVLADGPTIADLASTATRVVWSVATPTDATHATTKAYVDAIETALTTLIDGLDGDKEDKDFPGTGLYAGITRLRTAVIASEGWGDRWVFVPAAYEDADAQALDLAALTTTGGSPTPTEGVAPVPVVGFGAPVRVFVTGRVDPSEDGQYQLDDDSVWTKLEAPDVFDPPGNGYRVVVKPTDTTPMVVYTATMDGQNFVNRGGAFSDEDLVAGQPYRWTKDVVGASGAVDSVNGETGAVVLDASDVGALADDAATGWAHRATIPFSLLKPVTIATTWTPSYSNNAGGGHASGANSAAEQWTYTFPLAAGTYTPRSIARLHANGPIVDFTLSGGIGSIGTHDTWKATVELNNESALGGSFVVPADGYYTLTITCPTTSGAGNQMTLQVLELIRTGA